MDVPEAIRPIELLMYGQPTFHTLNMPEAATWYAFDLSKLGYKIRRIVVKMRDLSAFRIRLSRAGEYNTIPQNGVWDTEEIKWEAVQPPINELYFNNVNTNMTLELEIWRAP